MKEYPKSLLNAITIIGAFLDIYSIQLLKTQLVLGFVLSVLAYLMILNGSLVEIIRECIKYRRLAWKESKTLRKNCAFLLTAVLIICLMNFIFIRAKFFG